jgi:hypothetical protein
MEVWSEKRTLVERWVSLKKKKHQQQQQQQ